MGKGVGCLRTHFDFFFFFKKLITDYLNFKKSKEETKDKNYSITRELLSIYKTDTFFFVVVRTRV
jgi:hypothetical protein